MTARIYVHTLMMALCAHGVDSDAMSTHTETIVTMAHPHHGEWGGCASPSMEGHFQVLVEKPRCRRLWVSQGPTKKQNKEEVSSRQSWWLLNKLSGLRAVTQEGKTTS